MTATHTFAVRAEQLVDCPRCNGDGEVGFNPSPTRDPQCEDTARCPKCHGTGVVLESELV